MAEEIRIPDIGDAEVVEVIELCVAPGDSVELDDALIVIESDKASMEVPASVAGVIDALHVAVGDEVKEGDLIAVISAADGEEPSAVKEPSADREPSAVKEPSADREPSAVKEPSATDKEPSAAIKESAAPETSEIEIRVPDIGDAQDVEVIEVAVAVGDEVGVDDLLVVVESDKASMEIPAGQTGSIAAVHVEVGSSVEEGSLLVTITADQHPAAQPSAPTEAPIAPEVDIAAPAPTAERVSASSEVESVSGGTDKKVYAGPAVRRLARELGVDLAAVKGTGSRGRIVKDDVKSFVKGRMTAASSQGGASGIPPVPEVDFAKFGPIEIQALSRIRIAGAANLHRSWLNIPHVTQMEEADVTELEEFRRSLKEEALRRSLKITPLAFIIKACCYALKTYPSFNASLHVDGRNFVLKKYYHIGFAVDTEEGLVVPVIRDADRLGIWELSEAITDLAEKARTQSLGMNDMRGGSFSVSSLGNIGGTGFTPIINAPEVAILGVSRLTTKPIWDGSAFQPRQMLPLSLSYDHRAINGAEAGRFLASLSELLGDIRRLAL